MLIFLIAGENGDRGIIRKASQVSFIPKTSNSNISTPTQNTSAAHKPTRMGGNYTPNTRVTVSAKRPTKLPTPSSLPVRRGTQTKQVSFSDAEGKSDTEDQIVALTTKNLNMYNAMVLKTLRTQKFDDRWVRIELQVMPSYANRHINHKNELSNCDDIEL